MSTDKRILKTRTSIRNAFIALSLEKDISKISVSDVAAKALINRSTFYLHYNDVRAVANDIDELFANTISDCIVNFNGNDLYGSAYSMFGQLTDALDRDEPLKNYITNSKNSQHIAEKLKEIFVEKSLAALSATLPNLDRPSVSYLITFAAAGIIDCYLKWERSGREIPHENIIAQLSEITNFIIDKIR